MYILDCEPPNAYSFITILIALSHTSELCFILFLISPLAYQEVVTIPQGAVHIRVEEIVESRNYLGKYATTVLLLDYQYLVYGGLWHTSCLVAGILFGPW